MLCSKHVINLCSFEALRMILLLDKKVKKKTKKQTCMWINLNYFVASKNLRLLFLLFVFIYTFIFIWFEALGKMHVLMISFFFILLFWCLSGFIDPHYNTITNEEYKILLELCKVSSMSLIEHDAVTMSTIIKFWRSKGKFTNNRDVISSNWKRYGILSLEIIIKKQVISCYNK